MIDIFNPVKSVIADGLEGKMLLIYGSNSLGKTYQACRLPSPFVIATEYGLNGVAGIPFANITKWSDFCSVVSQFENPKAKEVYKTIIIDEVYASALYCQDYICNNIGNGAMTLSDAPDTKHNLYQAYEKEYCKQINKLASLGFTIVFIAHEQSDSKTGFITPKGDKRSINPIIDKCDYTIYLTSNGVDSEGKVIKSSAYLAATNQFFARSRFTDTPTYIKEFTAENLTAAIQKGVDAERAKNPNSVVSFAEQQEQKESTETKLDFETLIKEFNTLAAALVEKDEKKYPPLIVQTTEKYLGVGAKVNNCNANQVEAISLILNDLKQL